MEMTYTPKCFLIAAFLMALIYSPTSMGQDIKAPRLHVLENGLRVITVEDHSSPVVTTLWSVHVGDSAEPPDFAGNSHYLEHLLLFRGTEKYPGNEIGEWVASRGGYFNGSTWYDYTDFIIMSSPGDLEAALERHEQMMFHAAFSGEDFETEKKAVFEERRSGLDQPYGYLFRAAPYHMYPEETFYSRNTIGTFETVQAATVERVQQYYRDYYVPNNMSLAIVGDFDTETVLESVGQRFGSYSHKELPASLYQAVSMKPGITLVTEERDVNKAYFLLAFEGPRALAPEYFPFRLLAEYLAGGDTSVLYSNLVTEGKLLEEVFMTDWPRRYPKGWQAIGAEGDPVKVASAVDAIWRLLNKVKASGISETELEQARNRQLKAHREILDDQSRVAGELADNDAHGDYRLFSEFEDRLNRVTTADVQAVAQKYLNPQNFFMMSIFPQGAIPEGLEQQIRANAGDLADSGSGVSSIVLDSGLTLVHEARPGAAIEGITVAVRAGESTGEQAGLAEAVATMMSRETRQRSREELQHYLDDQGLSLNAWTDADAAYFSLQAPAGSTATAIQLLVEILTSPAFSEGEWDASRDELMSAIRSAQDRPQSVANDMLYSTVFAGTPYGRSMQDKAVALPQLSNRDLEDFWSKQYRTGAMAISYSGPASAAELTAELVPLEAISGAAPAMQAVQAAAVVGENRNALPMEGRAQANLYIAWPAPELSSEQWLYWELAQKAIGGDLAGRLWKLRQNEGLAYSVWMDGTPLVDQPITHIYMATAGEKREAALAAIHREIELAIQGLSQQELDRVKVSYLATLNRLDRMASRRANRHAHWWVQGHPPNRREELARIVNAATLDDVNAVVATVLDPNNYVQVEVGMVPE